MSYRRTRAVAIKEFRHIVRDFRSLIMALAVPLLLLLLFGFALSLDVDQVPTLVYDADQTVASRELIARFRGSRFFRITGYASGYPAIEKAIDRSQVLIGIVIPRGFAEHREANQRAPVQVLIDGSDSNTASIALGYVNALMSAYSFELRAEMQNRKGGRKLEPPVEPRMRVWYNSSLESKNYVVPGLIGVILMIIASLLTSLTIAREWEMGTMEQLLSTPLRPAEMVLGKMLAFFVVGVADIVIAVATGLLVFHVPFRGSPLLLIASSCIFLFGALFWGIFISAAAKNQLMAYQVGIITSFLPSFLLSGFVFSIETMPPAIQAITHIVPARYFITIIKGIYLKGVGLEVLAGEFLFLIAFAILVFIMATKKVRQKLV